MRPPAAEVIERRPALAPFVGRRVTVRAVVLRDSAVRLRGRTTPTTLIAFGAVAEAGWAKIGGHAWLQGAAFVADGLASPGDLVEFTAAVDCYQATDPASGQRVARYGLGGAADVRALGPVALRELLAELCDVYGWDAVADTVAGLHRKGA